MIPKKKKGFRKIVVDNVAFNWRFSELIEIRPEGNQTNQLEVDFGYFDSWLYANDNANAPENYEPKIITPSFVKKSIESAIMLGWNLETKNKLKKLKYRNGKFGVVEY